MVPKIALLIVVAYLLGSIPFGLLIARAHGIDLRRIGSGNIGATNVSRALGKRWAYVCFVLDCLKGLVPTFTAVRWLTSPTADAPPLTCLVVGCAAVLGHIYPVYLRFRGGKGASTGMGVMLGLWPYYTIPGLVTFAVWVAVLLVWRYVSLATIIGAAVFPIALSIGIALWDAWRFAALWPLVLVAAIMSVLVITRHAENIKRLLDGSEVKALQRRPSTH